MEEIWQQLGLRANPFDTVALVEGGNIDIKQAFVGRERERQILARVTASQSHSCIAICGAVGVGKTSLANVHKYHWKSSQKGKPLFSYRGEIEARRYLLDKRTFIVEIIATILRELELLDPGLIPQHEVLQGIKRIVDITQDASWSAGISTPAFGVEAGTGKATVMPPNLTEAMLEGYLERLIDFTQNNNIGGRHYKGLIIHVNNFDIVLRNEDEKEEVIKFFDEIRDVIQTDHMHFVFLGPKDFFNEIINSRKRVRSVFYSDPVVLDPLSKRELTEALTKRMELLQSKDISEYMRPFTDEVIYKMHDLYKGDVRSVLGALRDVVNELGDSFAHPLQPDEAFFMLARERWRRVQEKLTPSEISILQHFMQADSLVNQAEVAKGSGKAAPNISTYFKKFRQRGIIEIKESRGKAKMFGLTTEYAPLKYLKASQDSVGDRVEHNMSQLRLL